MIIEQGVKVFDLNDKREEYEFCLHEYQDENKCFHWYVKKRAIKNHEMRICSCDDKEMALSLAKRLNEDLKRGDV